MRLRSTGLAGTLLAGLGWTAAATAAPAADSAYYLDAQTEVVEDATGAAIGTVNMLLCIVRAVRADALVNRGVYTALVDQAGCDPRSKAAPARSATPSPGGRVNYRRAIVDAIRRSTAEPMTARLWLESEDRGQAVDIHIHLVVTAGPGDSNPNGAFTMNYCGRDPSGTVPGCIFRGRLVASTDGLSLYEDEAAVGSPASTRLRLASPGGADAGAGELRRVDSGGGTNVTRFAFDATHFRRDDGTDHCFSRGKDDAATSTWRYGVYDASGARLQHASGFPVRYTDAANNEFQGYLGYHGLFLPDAAGTANGDLVMREAADGGPGTPYTLVKLGGRLTKFTRRATTLAGVDRVRFHASAWRFPGAPVPAFVALAGKSFAQAQADNDGIELYWDEAAGTFRATALVSCGTDGCVTRAFPAEAAVDGAVLASGDLARGLPGYSEALGGPLHVELGGGAPSSATPVVAREQSLVYPDEYPSSLHCVSQCPSGARLTLGHLRTHDIHYAGNGFETRSSGLRTYVFSGDVLEDPDGVPVISTVPADQLAGTPYQAGVRTGVLADSGDLHALTELDCDPVSPTGSYCSDRIEALDAYYVWETGTQPWNRFTALQDGATGYVRFDPPLALRYTVPSGAAYGDYAGTHLVLQYGGFGDLWGIPGKCVSARDNRDASCAGGTEVRFVPGFSIPFSLTSGVATREATAYFVKWLDRELRLGEAPTGSCAALALPAPGALPMPVAGEFQDPTDPAQPSVYIGPKPAVSSAPAVIHGVVR